MASITTPVLSIVPSAKDLARADVTVKYTVTFDAFDIASGQPYHAHIDLRGDDTGTGDGVAAGADDQLWFFGAGDISAGGVAGHPQSATFSVPVGALDEDTGSIPNPDEIRANVTLTPLPAKVVGPVESNVVTFQL
jgi:hypothetical protein